jgi:protein-S-isoprenylcysteine O-methyltransferase Ste14
MSTTVRSAINLLAGILIFVGLPLVGWGIGDVQGFMTHAARLAYVFLSILLQALVVIRLPQVGGGRQGGGDIDRQQRLILMLIQLLSLAIVIVAPYSDRRAIAVLTGMDFLRYIGLVLFSLGFSGMHWAEFHLDKQFSVHVTIQEGHDLITDGPYRYLRHPRYLGIMLFTMGIALIYRSWLALILVALFTLVLIWRIQGEEALLHQEFGQDWEAYARRSWRLIPLVY